MACERNEQQGCVRHEHKAQEGKSGRVANVSDEGTAKGDDNVLAVSS